MTTEKTRASAPKRRPGSSLKDNTSKPNTRKGIPASKKAPVKKKATRPAAKTSAPTGLNKAFIRMQFSQKARLGIYKKLRKYLINNVSQPQALDTLYNIASDEGRKPKRTNAIILDQWRQTVREGKTLGEAVDGWVPSKDQVIIASGEAAGKLEIALENAIYIQESSKKITTAIRKGVSYPAVLLAMTIVFMFVVARVMVPAFHDIKPKETWTGSGSQMAALADFVDNYIVFVLAGFAALAAAIMFSMPRWTGKLRAKLDMYPPYSLYRLNTGSGFLLSLSALIASGVAIPQALRIIRKSANPWYRERIDKTLSKMDGGKTFGEALHETKLNFPDKEAVADIRVYATLNDFEGSLTQLGKDGLEDAVEKITEQSGVMRTACIMLIAGVFIWISGGMFSIQQQVVSSF